MRYMLFFVLFVLSSALFGCTEQAAQPEPKPESKLDAKSEPEKSAADPEAATGFTEKSGVYATKHMAAAATPAAAKAGEQILAAGGSAIDAGVAVQAMLGLTEPQSSGLGGGGFILYWHADDQKLYTIDARETAPLNATPELFLDAQGQPPESFMDAVTGGRSVGTPGIVRGLELAHTQWGKLPWQNLFTSSIDAAENGFVVSQRLQRLLELELSPGLLAMAPGNNYFYPNGDPLKAGTVKKNPDYAQTLRLIAANGADGFYQGPVADAIIDAVQNAPLNPGKLTHDDLMQYRATVREPVCAEYRVYEVCGMGPPSSGGVTVLQILGILENFPVGQWAVNSENAVHHFTQASRLAFADRNRYIADSDFIDVPINAMLDKSYLSERAQLISARDMGAAEAGVFTQYSYADDQSPELPNTTHVSIVDAEGNVFSMTASIEMGFGSGVMAAGFLLNNQLTDFSIVPEVDGKPVANRVEAGKRPRSSMSPMIVFNDEGQPVHAVGSPGGARIIDYVAQTLVALLDWNLDMQAAIDLPHATNLNGVTSLERNTEVEGLVEALRQRGHQVRVQDLNSGLHGISLLSDGRLYGGADPRREGIAAGNK